MDVGGPLSGRLVQSKINGTCHRASMEPAIGIHPNDLSGIFPEIARLVYGFQEWQQAWMTINDDGLCTSSYPLT